MLADLVASFVRCNKAMCRRVGKRWPTFTWYPRGGSHGEALVDRLVRLIDEKKRTGQVRVLEVGGMDRPLCRNQEDLQYDGLDIRLSDSWVDLYDNFHVQTIEEPIPGTYDIMVSLAVLEHVRDNTSAFRSMHDSLTDGGVVIHYIPSRFHPYSLALRAVGPAMQRRLIKLLRPWAQETTGYPTFFDKCSPGEMHRLLGRLGFSGVTTVPFYRANDYFSFCFPLFILVTLWENLCRRLKWKRLCSGFILVARREHRRR